MLLAPSPHLPLEGSSHLREATQSTRSLHTATQTTSLEALRDTASPEHQGQALKLSRPRGHRTARPGAVRIESRPCLGTGSQARGCEQSPGPAWFFPLSGLHTFGNKERRPWLGASLPSQPMQCLPAPSPQPAGTTGLTPHLDTFHQNKGAWPPPALVLERRQTYNCPSRPGLKLGSQGHPPTRRHHPRATEAKATRAAGVGLRGSPLAGAGCPRTTAASSFSTSRDESDSLHV